MRRWGWIVGVVGLLASASSGAADEQVRLVDALGPRSLGRGKHEVRFAAPASTRARFVLSVERRGAVGQLELNGTRIVAAGQLGIRSGVELVEVELRRENVLRVHVVGQGTLIVGVRGVAPASELPDGIGRRAAEVTLARRVFPGHVPFRLQLRRVRVPTTDGIFTLRAEQTGRVPALAAWVSWNGRPELGPLPLRHHGSADETPVCVAEENTLGVAALGFPRSAVTVTLTGWVVDETPPVVSWDPLPPAVELDTPLRVRFSDELSGVRELRVLLDDAEDVTSAFSVDADQAATTVAAVASQAAAVASGRHTLTAVVTDRAGGTSQASVTFDVGPSPDTTPPVLLTPGELTVEQEGPEGSFVSFVVTASDDRDAAPEVVCVPAPGTLFPAGSTAVTCTASDAAGNTTTRTFLVTVRDTTPPMLQLPQLPEIEQESPAGSIVHFQALAADAVDPEVVVECEPASGRVFPAGDTTVTCLARDAAGNVASGSFVVQVRDTTPPSLSTPPDLVVEQTSSIGAVVSFVVVATDAADLAPRVECAPASGAEFVAGVTTVTCTARDAGGNISTARFNVTVVDTTPPTLAVEPSDGAIVTLARVPVRLTFDDLGAGVDPTTVIATIDGVAIVLSASDRRADGVTDPLAPGVHELVATLSDRAGQSVSMSSRFEVAYPTLVAVDRSSLPATRTTTSSAGALVVANASDRTPLHLRSASATGPFRVEPALPPGGIVVLPGASATLQVVFTPDELGPVEGVLQLASNDPLDPLREIALDGVGTRGRVELAIEPGPPTGIDLGSLHEVRARAVLFDGATDVQFTGLLELRTTSPSSLDGLLLAFDEGAEGMATSPALPLFAVAGEHLITARRIDDGEPVDVGQLPVTVLDTAERGAFVCALDTGAYLPGQSFTARLFVDMGAPDGLPSALGDTLGAYDVRLLFDTRRFEVVRVEAGASVLAPPQWALPGSIRLMGLNDVGSLTAPQGPSVAATGIQEIARVVLRVRDGAPTGEAPFAAIADVLTTAEAAREQDLALQRLGDLGPRVGQVEGQVLVVSPQPAPETLSLLGTVPRHQDGVVEGLQQVDVVRAFFSEAVDPATLGAISVLLGGLPVEGEVQPGERPGEVVFRPSAPLTPGDYLLQVEPGLRAVGGNLLPVRTTTTFRVGAVVEPTPADLDRDGEVSVLDVQARRDVVTSRTGGAVPDFPPLFLTGGPGTVHLREGADAEIDLSIVDVEGEAVFLTADTLPPRSLLTRTSSTSFSLALHGSVSTGVSLTAASAGGGTTTAVIDVAVERVNTIPELRLAYPEQAELTVRVLEGEELFIDLEAVDVDLQAEVPDELTFTVLSAPVANLAGPDLFDNFASFYFAPTFAQAGRYPLRVQVSDRAGASDVLELEIEVVDVNHRPVLTSATASEELLFFEDEGDSQLVTLDFTGADPDEDDEVVVGLTNSTEEELLELTTRGVLQVLSRTSSPGRLQLVVQFRSSLTDVGEVRFEGYATDGVAFSDVRSSPRAWVTAAAVDVSPVVPLVRRTIDFDHDDDDATPPVRRNTYSAVAEVFTWLTPVDFRLVGAQSEKAVVLWAATGGAFYVQIEFPGPPDHGDLLLVNDMAAMELEVETEEGATVRRPVVFVMGIDRTSGAAEFEPLPLQVTRVVGQGSDLIRVGVRVSDPHLLARLELEGGAAVEELFAIDLDAPKAPADYDLVVRPAASGELVIRAHYRFTDETVEVSIPTTLPEDSGVFILAYRDGELVQRDVVPLLPRGAAPDEQAITADNPYVFFVAYNVSVGPAELRVRATNAAEFYQFAPSLPLPIGAPRGPIQLADGRILSSYVLSKPLLLEFRSRPPSDLTPFEDLGDRVVINVPLPSSEFMGVPEDAAYPPPGSAFLGSSPVFSADVRVLGGERQTIVLFTASAYGVAPHLVLDNDGPTVNDRPLDGAFVKCEETIRCWFPVGEGAPDFTLHLDDGQGEDRVVVPLAPAATSSSKVLEFSVAELVRALPQLNPGVHRLRLYPTNDSATPMTPLTSPPLTEPLLEATFELVIGNRALPFKTAPGFPAPECGGARPDDATQREVLQGDLPLDDEVAPATAMAGGTVLLATGEERLQRVDLVIPGRAGLDFVMARTYRSKIAFPGPLGHQWDFNWDEALFFNGEGVTRKSGHDVMEVWKPVAGTNRFQAGAGHFGVLVRQPDGYVLRFPDGRKHYYGKRLPVEGGEAGERGRLVRIEDRHGNSIQLRYDRATGQIDYIVDSYGREIDFTFERFADPAVELGEIYRLVSIIDFTGREVKYRYDRRGDLVAARAPNVSGQTDRTERYAYHHDETATGSRRDLNHNLVKVWSPEESEGGAPTQTLEYDAHDRVITETIGGVNASGRAAGGTRRFFYDTTEHPSFGFLRRAIVTEPDGSVHHHLITDDSLHEVVTRVFTGQRRPGEPEYYETVTTYNEHGLPVHRRHPEGNVERFTYGSGSRGAQRHLVEHVRVPDDDRGGGLELVTRYMYEPLYGQLASITEPRGTSTTFVPPVAGSVGPARYTTTFTFDWQEGNAPVADAVTFLINTASYVAVSNVPLPRGLGDVNGDERTNQVAGNVVRTTAPSVRRAANVHETVVTDTHWNDHGQPVAVLDPLGFVTAYEYFDASDPDGDGNAENGVPPGPSGYVRAVIVDAATPRSVRRTSAATPLALRTSYEYDPRGAMTAVTNPRGVRTELTRNEVGEVTQVERDPGRLGLITRYAYDRNGRCTQIERGHAKSTDKNVTPAITTETRVYDILGDLVERSVTVSPDVAATTRFDYDPARRLSALHEDVAPGTSVSTRLEYDGRGLLFRVTRGADTPRASTIQFDYDGNGNRVRVTDSADTDGDGQRESTTFAYDGFDRLTTTTDALGTVQTLVYDPASQVVRRVTVADGTTLEDVGFDHDELGRVFRTRARWFVPEGVATARPHGLSTSSGAAPLVVQETVFDVASRPVRRIDPEGRFTFLHYDGASRLVATVDALGNEVARTYDENGNPTQIKSVERSPEGLLVEADTVTTTLTYDPLDRLTRSTDAAQQTTWFYYDARDNLVRRVDPEGSVCRYTFDGLDRLTEQVWELKPDHELRLTYEFDLKSRLTGITDGNGQETSFVYDELDRLTSKSLPPRAPGQPRATYAYAYDPDDNLRTTTDPNGTSVTRSYDALNRLTGVLVVAGAGVLGTVQEAYTYDGLGRLVSAIDDNGDALSGPGVGAHAE